MERQKTISAIKNGETALGIELGSTRIKSVLINNEFEVIASGFFNWENRLENKLWTYRLKDAIRGIQCSFQSLVEDVSIHYGIELDTIGCIGISGMMHGIIALDENNNQLSPFLTWRNTNTSEAAEQLTGLFNFNIPLRWTIAQLYQAILNKEDLALFAIDILTKLYKEKLENRYNIKVDNMTNIETMEEIAKKRGCVTKGNITDYERVSSIILNDIKNNAFKEITLDRLEKD